MSEPFIELLNRPRGFGSIAEVTGQCHFSMLWWIFLTCENGQWDNVIDGLLAVQWDCDTTIPANRTVFLHQFVFIFTICGAPSVHPILNGFAFDGYVWLAWTHATSIQGVGYFVKGEDCAGGVVGCTTLACMVKPSTQKNIALMATMTIIVGHPRSPL